MVRQPAAADAALARAVVYRMLSLAFEPPSRARLEENGARDGFAAVVAALRFLDRANAGSLDAAAARLEALAVADEETLSADYWRLFGHTTRGLICACETEYGPDNGFHQPQQLSGLGGHRFAALASGLQKLCCCRDRGRQPASSGGRQGFPLAGQHGLQMSGVVDPLTAVVAAAVAGDLGAAVEQAHGGG